MLSLVTQESLFVRAASVNSTNGKGNFKRVWRMLGNIPTLVVEVNSSPSYNNVHELIRWTRIGEENAGNVSALIQKSLFDLKNSRRFLLIFQ